MQTFESGGALWLKPRGTMRIALRALGLVAATVALPPAVGIYLLIVA